MGYNIGTRLIEDFLAKSNIGRCADFREVGEVVAKVRNVRYLSWKLWCSNRTHLTGWLQIIPQYKSRRYTWCPSCGCNFANKCSNPSAGVQRRIFHSHFRRKSTSGIRGATGGSVGRGSMVQQCFVRCPSRCSGNGTFLYLILLYCVSHADRSLRCKCRYRQPSYPTSSEVTRIPRFGSR